MMHPTRKDLTDSGGAGSITLEMADVVQREKLKVSIHTTSNLLIQGEVTVTGGYRGRLSDLLNDPKVFILMHNAEVHTAEGKLLAKYPFLCVNKNNASLVIEE